jgi:hypothetical protein
MVLVVDVTDACSGHNLVGARWQGRDRILLSLNEHAHMWYARPI